MPWPSTIVSGANILDTLNAIINALPTWQGNVNAAGFDLGNVGKLGIEVYVDLKQEIAPSAPPAGYARRYVDSADGIYKLKKPDGTVINLEAGSAGSAVTSVFGRSGVVVAVSGDYSAAQVTNAFNLAADNALGAHFVEITQIAAPGNPAAGKVRLFLNTATGELSVRKSGGTTVSLEGGGFNFADNETPSGTINGTNGTDGNATFTLAHTPSPAASLCVYSNGALLVSGTAFTLSTATITFLSGYKPITGDLLRVCYRY